MHVPSFPVAARAKKRVSLFLFRYSRKKAIN